MAKLVREVMNRELFWLEPENGAEDALQQILTLGVTGAPVLNKDRKPIGFASLRDLAATRSAGLVSDRMSRRVVTASEADSLENAALVAVTNGIHHLVVVNEFGSAVGIVSVLDLLAGLIGYPAQHPATFPHLDRVAGLQWSEDVPLAFERLVTAPDAAGVFALVHGGFNQSEKVVWVEAANNVRTRLYELLSLPQEDTHLAHLLSSPRELRFRAARVDDPGEREDAIHRLNPNLY